MFSFEDGASQLINKATDDYYNHFGEEFPLFEYKENGEYDFTLKNANRIVQLIKKAVKDDKPIDKPRDYEERIY